MGISKPILMWDDDGSMSWFDEGTCHRVGDKPAAIWEDGLEWYKNDKSHRVGDQPNWIDMEVRWE